MGDDLNELIEKFKKGVKLTITPDSVYPMWGLSEPVIGKVRLLVCLMFFLVEYER